jgi:hypothetical protein
MIPDTRIFGTAIEVIRQRVKVIGRVRSHAP